MWHRGIKAVVLLSLRSVRGDETTTDKSLPGQRNPRRVVKPQLLLKGLQTRNQRKNYKPKFIARQMQAPGNCEFLNFIVTNS